MRTLNRAQESDSSEKEGQANGNARARGEETAGGEGGLGNIREEATPRITRCCLSFALERVSPSPPVMRTREMSFIRTAGEPSPLSPIECSLSSSPRNTIRSQPARALGRNIERV
jgi:hypothetical protein